MSLQGNLSTIILPDVIQWLSQGLKTGVLHVLAKSGVSKKVFIRDGRIISTSCSDPREYFGQFLISRGYLTEEQLNDAMETHIKTGVKLGQVLVTAGLLGEDDVMAMLRLKAEESLFDLFMWPDGEFQFEDRPDRDEGMPDLGLDITSLLMEGMRRKDEWPRIRQLFPNDRVVLAHTDSALETESLDPHSLLLRTYQTFDGMISIAEAALELHSTEFLVSDSAFKLCERGLLKIAGEKPDPEERAYQQIQKRLLAEASKALQERRYDEALNLYRYLQKAQPGDEQVSKGLTTSEEAVSQHYFKQVVPLNTILELVIPLQQLTRMDLTPQEGYLASRANGAWDIGAILKVSPLPEKEALRAIRKLLDRGVLRAKNR